MPATGGVCVTYQSRGTDMAGKFVLTKTASGGFHFNLKASNGQTIATSETYNTKAAALNGIESIRAHASEATLDDQTD
jgi:uncharacterized protein